MKWDQNPFNMVLELGLGKHGSNCSCTTLGHYLTLRGCIELWFQGILKDFFKIKKSGGIQSRLL